MKAFNIILIAVFIFNIIVSSVQLYINPNKSKIPTIMVNISAIFGWSCATILLIVWLYERGEFK